MTLALRVIGIGMSKLGMWLSWPGNELANAGIALHNWAVDREAQAIEARRAIDAEGGVVGDESAVTK